MSLSRMVSTAGKYILGTVKVGLGTFLTLHFVGGFVICKGPSMEPTLETGNVLLTDYLSPRFGRVNVGDIVVAKTPKNDYVCKRVVSSSGDRVNYRGRIIPVPENHVWLEGDNKEDSHDSRHYGPIPNEQVKGRCYCKVWPDLDFSTFRGPTENSEFVSKFVNQFIK